MSEKRVVRRKQKVYFCGILILNLIDYYGMR